MQAWVYGCVDVCPRRMPTSLCPGGRMMCCGRGEWRTGVCVYTHRERVDSGGKEQKLGFDLSRPLTVDPPSLGLNLLISCANLTHHYLMHYLHTDRHVTTAALLCRGRRRPGPAALLYLPNHSRLPPAAAAAAAATPATLPPAAAKTSAPARWPL